MPLGPSALEAFQFGREVAGTSAFGTLVKDVTERIKQMDLLKAKAQYDVGADIYKEQALFPFRVAEAGGKAKAEAEAQAEVARNLPESGGGGFRATQYRVGPITYERPFTSPGEIQAALSKVRQPKLFGVATSPSAQRQNADEIGRIMDSMTSEHVSYLKNLVDTGHFRNEDIPRLSSQWDAVHPELTGENPFGVVSETKSPLLTEEHVKRVATHSLVELFRELSRSHR